MFLKLAICLQFSLFLLVDSAAISGNNGTKCDRLLYQTDSCFKKVMKYGETSIAIPRTVDELKEGCKSGEEDEACFKNYALQCLDLLPKTMFKISYRQTKEQFKEVCDTEKGQQAFLTHTKCLMPEQLPVVHRFVHLSALYMDYVAKNVTIDDVIPYLCCGYFMIVNDGIRTVNELCKEDGPATVEYLLSISTSVSSELISAGCGPFGGLEKCNASLPNALEVYGKLTQMVEDSSSEPVDFTPVVPAIQIIGRLNDDLPNQVRIVVLPLLNNSYVYLTGLLVLAILLLIIFKSCIADALCGKSREIE